MSFVDLIGVWTTGPRDEAVPSNTATPIDLPRGTDATIGFTLVDSLGELVDLDLAGLDRLVLSVRQTQGAEVLFDVLATKLNALGSYQFVITSARTIDYGGKLIYDVWATKEGAQQQVKMPAYLHITPRMRS